MIEYEVDCVGRSLRPISMEVFRYVGERVRFTDLSDEPSEDFDDRALGTHAWSAAACEALAPRGPKFDTAEAFITRAEAELSPADKS